MKDAVIFDMDGVLVDSEQVYFDHLMTFLSEQHVEPFSKDIKDYVGASSGATWEKLFRVSDQRQIMYSRYLRFGEEHPVDYGQILQPGAKELLEFLCSENFRVALASAGRPMDIEQMLDDTDLRRYFDVVLSGEAVAHNKPAPDVYLKAAQQLGTMPESSLVIEDSAKGIMAAKSANIEVWAIAHSYNHDDIAAADRIVSGLTEVHGELTKMLLMP